MTLDVEAERILDLRDPVACFEAGVDPGTQLPRGRTTSPLARYPAPGRCGVNWTPSARPD